MRCDDCQLRFVNYKINDLHLKQQVNKEIFLHFNAFVFSC